MIRRQSHYRVRSVMVTIQAAETAALSATLLRDIRSMLDNAFDGDFSDDDWRHATGGIHAWLLGPPGLISHGSLVQRTLVCSGHTLSAGYVEAVATATPHRRQGHGTTLMRYINHLIRERYALGALSTDRPAFYESLGWECWRGPTLVDTPLGRERTPDDDGGVMILSTSRTPRLDLDGEIVCDWRAGDAW